MSDQTPGQGPGEEGTPPAPTGTTRSASVQLREEESSPAQRASMMDPANQSLAEALRITFRILQGAMVVLLVLYIASGFQSVKANERGLRVLTGRISATDLRPGFQWAAPYPFGELIHVDVGNKDLEVNRAFWPYVEPGKEDTPLESLRSRASLDPSQDGSLLTGDGAIAHTQWSVQFRRSDARQFVETIYPPHETGFVRAAIARGVVHAVAGVGIDDLLKQSSQEQGSVALRATDIARQTLSNIGEQGSGLDIEQMALKQRIPPVYLRENFNGVLQAASRASKAREDAQRDASTLLSATAGGSAGLLIELIDEYERQYDLGQEAEAAVTLTKIDRLLDGDAVEIDGEEVRVALGGEVATLVSRARQYRDGAVDLARSELTRFEAKLAQFQTNPSVMIATDWSDALGAFFSDDDLEIFFNPSGTDTLELVINADPTFRAARERAEREAENTRVREERLRMIEEGRYETQEGLQTRGG
ncbi:MAG: hypothetical protein HND58_07880 [Planctomycetota bacterium]|nr:MAG: hypothetical protein HND58_07880 [Planctomycetota bacterium]